MRLTASLWVLCAVSAGFAACSANDASVDETGGAGGIGASSGNAGNAGSGIILDSGSEGGIDAGTRIILGPGADADAPNKFNVPDDPAAGVDLVYPATNVVLPPNLNALEFHFTPRGSQRQFELSFVSPRFTYKEYVGCQSLAGGCTYTPNEAFWKELARAAAGKEFVSWRIRGLDADGKVGSSEERKLAFAAESFTGGIYYWNTGGQIQRFDFGIPYRRAENFLAPTGGGRPGSVQAGCIGCHALSRDGRRIAFGQDFPGVSPYKVFEVGTRLPYQINGANVAGNGQAFYSFSPDASQLLMGNGLKIEQRDLTTGTVREVLKLGTQPDWSQDGAEMVYAKPAQSPLIANGSVASASIQLMGYAGSTWTPKATIVPFQGQNNYYPAFSPLQEWVIFNRSPGNQDSMSNSTPNEEAGTVPDGQLWMVQTASKQQVRLANAEGNSATSWPKWVPGVFTYDNGKRVMWFTYSSARAYGLRLGEGDRVQLWMAAVDPDAAANGDPSKAAIWLPFQDIRGGNHIAQWVTKVIRQPCNAGAGCDGNETCQDGQCVPVVE
jgi:hypothetical protein